MILFSQLLALHAAMGLLLPQSSIAITAGNIWNHLSICSEVNLRSISKCYDVSYLTQNLNEEKKKQNLLEEEGFDLKPSGNLKVNEGKEISFKIRLKKKPSNLVRIIAKVIKGQKEKIRIYSEDHSDPDNILAFNSDNWKEKRDINILALDDDDDKDEQLIIEFVSSGYGYSKSYSEKVYLTINDNNNGDPPIDDPPTDDPPTDDPPTDDPPTDDPPTDDPPTGDPPTDDPPTDDPPTGDPPTGDCPAGDCPADNKVILEFSASQFSFSGNLERDQEASFAVELESKLENQQEVIVKIKTNNKNVEYRQLKFNNNNQDTKQQVIVRPDDNTASKKFDLYVSSNSNNQLKITQELDYSKIVDSTSNLAFLKRKIDLNEGNSSGKIYVKLTSKPENLVRLKINTNSDLLNIENNELDFNSDNWNEYQYFAVLYQEDSKINNDQPVAIDLTMSVIDENDVRNFSLMRINPKDNDKPIGQGDDGSDDGPLILIGILVISTAALGLGGISSIFKNLGNEWDELRNAIEITSQTHRFFKERATQENLEEKLDEINARLDSIETKIDEKNS